ncbi:hypothetical protein Ocin01_13989 [Orchesella cincta]|uniref:Uncharacterized protein n=1 Tax=Orchesella cincta TaxID=48709 RepID=A0A1D2MIQ7_ORCCI|nr:hypothetical protein Ocin01_13989 [Orchesella cincta]
MRTVEVVLVLFCVTGSLGESVLTDPATPKNGLDDLILYLINTFKNIAVNGSECYGIPPLDPLLVPNAAINISQQYFRINGGINNATAIGLRGLEATSVTSNLIQLTVALQMVLPEIVAEGNYDIDGLAMLIFPVYGHGPFRVKIGGLQMGGTGSLGVKLTGEVFLKNLDFNFTLGEMDVRLEGLLGGGELGDLINDVINAIGLNIVSIVEKVLHEIIAETLLLIINHQLEGVTLVDLIGGLIPGPGTNCTGGTTIAPPGFLYN